MFAYTDPLLILPFFNLYPIVVNFIWINSMDSFERIFFVKQFIYSYYLLQNPLNLCFVINNNHINYSIWHNNYKLLSIGTFIT